MKFIYIVLLVLTMYGNVFSQPAKHEFAEIGYQMPDYTFNDVEYYKMSKVSISDFKGQWLILDCWNRMCGACLENMPLTDSLQKQFNGKVKFLLIGYTGSQYTNYQQPPDDRKIRNLFEVNRSRMNLDLSIAYDSTFFHKFKIAPCPYIIIISPKGTVMGVTYKLDRHELENILMGKSVILRKAYRRDQME